MLFWSVVACFSVKIHELHCAAYGIVYKLYKISANAVKLTRGFTETEKFAIVRTSSHKRKKRSGLKAARKSKKDIRNEHDA